MDLRLNSLFNAVYDVRAHTGFPTSVDILEYQLERCHDPQKLFFTLQSFECGNMSEDELNTAVYNISKRVGAPQSEVRQHIYDGLPIPVSTPAPASPAIVYTLYPHQ